MISLSTSYHQSVRKKPGRWEHQIDEEAKSHGTLFVLTHPFLVGLWIVPRNHLARITIHTHLIIKDNRFTISGTGPSIFKIPFWKDVECGQCSAIQTEPWLSGYVWYVFSISTWMVWGKALEPGGSWPCRSRPTWFVPAAPPGWVLSWCRKCWHINLLDLGIGCATFRLVQTWSSTTICCNFTIAELMKPILKWHSFILRLSNLK